VERAGGTLGEISLGPWSTAGIRDYWLGGSYHTVADREVAEHLLVEVPHLARMVRVYRAFVGRVVRYLVRAGVRQFLDLGAGLPTAGNVHEVVKGFGPNFGCRVAYVDIDPWVVAESRKLLTDHQDVAIVQADLRQPEQVFDAVGRCGLLDLGAPVAVLAIDVLHHTPDVDKPIEFMATYLDAVCSGSYVSIAHTGDDEALLAGLTAFNARYHIPVPSLTFRSSAQVSGFFDKLNLVEPGVVSVPLWRSESNGDPSADLKVFPSCCGLGCKS
jgi:hypothetical protein